MSDIFHFSHIRGKLVKQKPFLKKKDPNQTKSPKTMQKNVLWSNETILKGKEMGLLLTWRKHKYNMLAIFSVKYSINLKIKRNFTL